MAIYYPKNDRPGVYKVIGSLKGKLKDSGSTPGGGGEPTAGTLTLSDDGVLIYTGEAPTMDGTTLVYSPTPTMAGTVMTIS